MGLMKALGNDLVKPYTNAYNAPWYAKVRPQVTGGLVGAGVGATATSIIDGGMGGAAGAAVGAVAGSLALPAMGLVGSGIGHLGMKAVNNPMKIGNAMAGVGTGMIGTGKAAAGAAGMAGKTGYYGAKKMGNIAGSLIKYKPEETKIQDGKLVTKRGKFRPTALGYTVAAGIAGVMGASNLTDYTFDRKAGTPSGARTATPNYMDNAGATGDLVFAMHQNRRG